MKVIVHFRKPQYTYISDTAKKAINAEIIRDVELIINEKEQLIIDLNDGSSVIYKQKIVSGIVVKKENKDE